MGVGQLEAESELYPVSMLLMRMMSLDLTLTVANWEVGQILMAVVVGVVVAAAAADVAVVEGVEFFVV